MEVEFVSLDKSSEEAEWLRQFLEDIPDWTKLVSAICIHCDSQSIIGRARMQCTMVSQDIFVDDTIPLDN